MDVVEYVATCLCWGQMCTKTFRSREGTQNGYEGAAELYSRCDYKTQNIF